MANNGSKYNLTGVVKDTSGFNSKDITPKTVTTTEINTKRLNVDEEAVINDLTANSISASQVIVNGLFKTTARSTIDINGLTSINNTVYVLTMTQFESELVKAAVNGGTSIVVAPGEFIVSSPLTVPANTDIRGSGMNTTIFKARSGFGTANPMFNFTGSNSSMSDLQLNGNAGTVTLLKQTSVNFVFLDKLKFTNTSGTMLELDSATKSNITNILFRTKPSSAYSALYIYGNTQDCIFSNLYFIDVDENTTNDSGAAIYIKPNGSAGSGSGTDVVSGIIFNSIRIRNSDLSSSFRSRLVSMVSDGASGCTIEQIMFFNIGIEDITLNGTNLTNFNDITEESSSVILAYIGTVASIRDIMFSGFDINNIISSGTEVGQVFHLTGATSTTEFFENIQFEKIKITNFDTLLEAISILRKIKNVVISQIIVEKIFEAVSVGVGFSACIFILQLTGTVSSNIVISNVISKNFGLLYLNGSDNCIVSNNSCEGAIPSVTYQVATCNNVAIINNYILNDTSSTKYSIVGFSIPGSNSILFSNNIIKGLRSSLLVISSSANISINNSIFDGSDITSGVGIINISSSTNLSISGCTIIGNTSVSGITGILNASSITAISSLSIVDNIFTSLETGISFNALSFNDNNNIIINNNKISNHTNGILIQDLEKGVTVSNNIIQNPFASSGIGISIFYGASSVVTVDGELIVTNNVISGHTTGLNIAYPKSGLYYHGIVTNNRITSNTTNLAISHHASNTNSELIVRDNNTVRTVTAATATVSIAQLDDRVYLDTTSNAIAITLSDLELSYMGMRVTFYFQTRPGTNNVTITPGTTGIDIPGLAAYTTNVVMNAAGQQVVFEWTGSAWDLRGYSAAVVVT